jgi:hypothetical protein
LTGSLQHSEGDMGKIEEWESALSQMNYASLLKAVGKIPEYDRRQLISQIIHTQEQEQGEFDLDRLPPNIHRLLMLIFELDTGIKASEEYKKSVGIRS